LEAGYGAGPTQPPHPSLIVDVPSGYPEDFETFGTPDTVDIADIQVTPEASGVHATSYPDMSVSTSMSILMIIVEKSEILHLMIRLVPTVWSEILHMHFRSSHIVIWHTGI